MGNTPSKLLSHSLVLALLAVVLVMTMPAFGQAPARTNDSGHPAAPLVTGMAGMVSSAHPVATRVGVDVLVAGGNAFDAAVAVAATLNVVEPMMSGMGGYGAIVIYDARGRQVRYLDASGRIPLAVDADVFRPPTPNYLENRHGAKAIATPSNVHAWEALWRAHGSQPMRSTSAWTCSAPSPHRGSRFRSPTGSLSSPESLRRCAVSWGGAGIVWSTGVPSATGTASRSNTTSTGFPSGSRVGVTGGAREPPKGCRARNRGDADPACRRRW